MDANVCIICKQPILGYWHEIGKNKSICQSCAAVTSVYDLFQRGIIDIKPDIVETEAVVYQEPESLVTKVNDEKNSPEQHYEGDKGNDTGEAMCVQWEAVNPASD